ncbi:MAG: FKBP-type peptidyl-prolyl cis-trans isomerase [Planctomycetes bacterium]|nr:FKBP-type peptidyl-prolyl cis-trans isomerase [Planctomycetota bacterium]
MIELEIPYQLAYGKAGRPPTIPAKADLRFVVELLAVNPSPAARHGSGKIDVTNFKPKAAPLPKLPEGAGSIDADAPAELVFTKTGLYYRILRKSEGKKAQWNGTVKVHYQGTLDNGEQFDSSYERKEPAEFDLRDVVAGWTEGLQLVGEGGMIELDIPYQLGYGHEGRPPRIPPGANLHFIIEIISVK